MPNSNTSDHNYFNRVFSALFYAISSILIVFANKIVLTSYSFPSFQIIAIGQLTFSLIGLCIANYLNFIKLPHFNISTINKIMPLPIFYFGNLLFGLGGTKALNLPMFVVLRRFSVLMTMYAEIYVLNAKKSLSVHFCVYGMVGGALIAAYTDLTFEFYGYMYLMLNNIFSTANSIAIKDKLSQSNLDEYGLLYYNSLFATIPMIILSIYSGEINKVHNFEHWFSFGFWFFFTLSSIMGFLLNFSVMLCTRYNSPLSTTVFGCLKNIFVSFGGIFVGGDYVFDLANFTGLTISALSSIIYSFVTLKSPSKPQLVQSKSSIETPDVEPEQNHLKQILVLNNPGASSQVDLSTRHQRTESTTSDKGGLKTRRNNSTNNFS